MDIFNIAELAAPWEAQTARVLKKPYDIHREAYDAFERNAAAPTLPAKYRNEFLKNSLGNDYMSQNYGDILSDKKATADYTRQDTALNKAVLDDTFDLQLSNAGDAQRVKAEEYADQLLQYQSQKDWAGALANAGDVEGETPYQKKMRVAREMAASGKYNGNRHTLDLIYKQIDSDWSDFDNASYDAGGASEGDQLYDPQPQVQSNDPFLF